MDELLLTRRFAPRSGRCTSRSSNDATYPAHDQVLCQSPCRDESTIRGEVCSPFQPYTSSLPVKTSSLRNLQWRTSSMRSLPPVWYQRLSQSKAMISSVVKPHCTSFPLSEASVSRCVCVMSSSAWIG